MSGVEFLEIRVSDDGRTWIICGTFNAHLLAHALMRKDYLCSRDMMQVYFIAQEMRMNLVSGYPCKVAERPGSCRCFQGNADFIASMVDDPQYAGLIEEASRQLDSL